MFFQIGLGLIILAALVLAYLAIDYWHWYHVTVVVLLLFCGVGYSFFAAKILAKRVEGQKRASELEARLLDYQAVNIALDTGTKDGALLRTLRDRDGLKIPDDAEAVVSLAEKRHQAQTIARLRGRSWDNGQPAFDQATSQIVVSFPGETLVGIRGADANTGANDGTVLYVFEQGEPNAANGADSRQYVGEFRALSVQGEAVTLEPVQFIDDPQEMQRITRASGPWVLYESMPVDTHDVFSGVPEETLKAWFPNPAIADEYIRDGGPLTEDDSPDRKQGYDPAGKMLGPESWKDDTTFRYSRRLRDYAFLIHDYKADRVRIQAEMAAAQSDGSRLKSALESAQRMAEFRQAELQQLNVERERLAAELGAIRKLHDQVQQQLATAQRLFDQTLASNLELTNQLRGEQQAAVGGDLQLSPPPAQGGLDRDAL